MSLPLISPPEPVVPDILLPDWSGPFGAPVENNRIPVSPPTDGTSFLALVENHFPNPSLEYNMTGWDDQGTYVLSRSRDNKVFGAYCGVLTSGAGPSTNLIAFTIPSSAYLDPGERVLCSLYVFHPTSWDGGSLHLSINTSDPGWSTLRDIGSVTSNHSSWQRISFYAKNGPTTASSYTVYLVTTSAPSGSGKLLYVDGFQLIPGAEAYDYTYFDGDSGDSFWTGTPHASASKRALHPTNNRPRVDWFISAPVPVIFPIAPSLVSAGHSTATAAPLGRIPNISSGHSTATAVFKIRLPNVVAAGHSTSTFKNIKMLPSRTSAGRATTITQVLRKLKLLIGTTAAGMSSASATGLRKRLPVVQSNGTSATVGLPIDTHYTLPHVQASGLGSTTTTDLAGAGHPDPYPGPDTVPGTSTYPGTS